jgi:zinc transporter ZupT
MSSDPSSSLLLASSIGLHQPAESMALLVSLLKSSLSKPSIIAALVVFSLIGPLGSFLGNLITTTKLPFLEGILVSMTAGTFLYAAATEVRIKVTRILDPFLPLGPPPPPDPF